MIPVLGGALTLVLVELALSTPATAGRLGQLGSILANVLARFVDPTVPAIGSTTGTATGTGAQTIPGANLGPTPNPPAGPSSTPETPAGAGYPAYVAPAVGPAVPLSSPPATGQSFYPQPAEY